MAFFKSMWKASSKHKKLPEELSLQNCREVEEDDVEIEEDVVTFKLKYLGTTVVEKVLGENISTEAVKSIIKTTKASRKKLTRVNLSVSLKGIAVTDLQGNDIFKISIYRISNCATDPTHRQVFSFISTDSNETTECHAFHCTKRKLVETVALAVAHAFSTAYEAWRILPATLQFEQKAVQLENDTNTPTVTNEEVFEDRRIAADNIMDQLIDLEEPSEHDGYSSDHYVNHNDWLNS